MNRLINYGALDETVFWLIFVRLLPAKQFKINNLFIKRGVITVNLLDNANQTESNYSNLLEKLSQPL